MGFKMKRLSSNPRDQIEPNRWLIKPCLNLHEVLWCRNLQIAFTCHFKQGTECLKVILGEKQRLAVGHCLVCVFWCGIPFLGKKNQFLMDKVKQNKIWVFFLSNKRGLREVKGEINHNRKYLSGVFFLSNLSFYTFAHSKRPKACPVRRGFATQRVGVFTRRDCFGDAVCNSLLANYLNTFNILPLAEYWNIIGILKVQMCKKNCFITHFSLLYFVITHFSLYHSFLIIPLISHYDYLQ